MGQDYEDAFLADREEEARLIIRLLGAYNAFTGPFRNVPQMAEYEQAEIDKKVRRARNFLEERARVAEPKKSAIGIEPTRPK